MKHLKILIISFFLLSSLSSCSKDKTESNKIQTWDLRKQKQDTSIKSLKDAVKKIKIPQENK